MRPNGGAGPLGGGSLIQPSTASFKLIRSLPRKPQPLAGVAIGAWATGSHRAFNRSSVNWSLTRVPEPLRLMT